MNAPLLARPIAIRRADPGDAARATAYVAARADGSPFHTPAWCDVVADGCGQASRYLIAEHRDGAIAGVLPLTLVRSRLFGSALVSSAFGVDGGVLADEDAVAVALTDAAWTMARSEGAASLELRGATAPPGFHSDTTTYLGFARDLAVDDDAELLAIPRKQRAEVRRALGNGLSVDVGRGERDLVAHYAVYAESVRNLGTPVFPRALFAAALARLDADILTVRHDGAAVASVLSLYWQGTVLPYWGGGTSGARALRANDLMYYALMCHARARGCARFDFGRSKAGTGAAAFKKNWGFDGVPLAYHVRTANGAVSRVVNPLDPRYARKVALWKKLPLPIANMIGPYLARGLG